MTTLPLPERPSLGGTLMARRWGTTGLTVADWTGSSEVVVGCDQRCVVHSVPYRGRVLVDREGGAPSRLEECESRKGRHLTYSSGRARTRMDHGLERGSLHRLDASIVRGRLPHLSTACIICALSLMLDSNRAVQPYAGTNMCLTRRENESAGMLMQWGL